MDSLAAPEFQPTLQIPIDLFVSKQHGPSGDLRFTDASGSLVFSVHAQASDSTSAHRKRLLRDASGNPLITICRNSHDSWQGFRGDADREEGLIFRVERTLNTTSRTEFEVFPVGENLEVSKSGLKMKGCPFRRSCTIYRSNSIVAQTSLMYKLGIQKLFVSRSRFRLTIFPEFVDHSLVVALIVVFFYGRKFWI